MNPFSDINWAPAAPDSPESLLLNLGIGAVLASVLAWHYVRFGRAISNRAAVAHVFLIIVLASTFTISILRSSIVLAVGLFGALSLVRFRTPIKEPEELAYLFLAVAVGLGLGADQPFLTVTAFVFILAVLTVHALFRQSRTSQSLYVAVDMPIGQHERVFPAVYECLLQHSRQADVRRVVMQDGLFQATFFVDCRDKGELLSALESMRRLDGRTAISLVEQHAGIGA